MPVWSAQRGHGGAAAFPHQEHAVVTERQSLPLVSCDGCGACCMAQGSPPGYRHCTTPPQGPDDLVPDGDYWRFWTMPEALRAELLAYYDRVPARRIPGGGHPCLWLDLETRQCRHYEHRPELCRQLPVDGPSCLSWRTDYGIVGSPRAAEGLDP
jgi:uncharacterized protein